jgi:hypothetical protein
MNRIALLLLLTILAAPATAQDPASVVKPEIRVGDSWTYRSKNVLENGAHTYELRVERSDGKTILAVGTRKGDDKEFDGTFTPEWNPVVGVSGLIFTPPPSFFSFPMQVGDVRTLAYTSSRPRVNVPPTRFDSRVQVVGWEEVTVPAGRFRAIKIVADGIFFPPFARGPAKNRATYWYVPEVRRWVKLLFETPTIVAEEELVEYKLNEN